jgi:hypothetical protein
MDGGCARFGREIAQCLRTPRIRDENLMMQCREAVSECSPNITGADDADFHVMSPRS